ncbi:phosphatase PAP2 family protein [Legionella jordanis]|uniref:PAP2 superfamily protein n=2 Tax=Legionella jordanis TaxID=456 RepID=A0A0W0VDV3_9GAMM|nr:PAP2 superfamily protein [Legionella jordanis]RMX02254.1 phosphatase PAP2 family protein [Legionella jordanis]RMX21261.1 phosphatase PAP2 family protein [Legionella jordanis]VEH13847.1 PAP2 superfamily [Legionella jordanis]
MLGFMSDHIASFFLLFSHALIIIPVLCIGYIWLNRELFFKLIHLVLLTILLNIALKVSFQVPLPASLGKHWFAFPSGHMQLATALYGWFIYQCSNVFLRALLLFLLSGIGFSLVYCGYHGPQDVIGALIFSTLLLCSFQFLTFRYPQHWHGVVLTVGLLLLLYSQWMWPLPAHAWMAFYSLLGLNLAELLFNVTYLKSSTKKKIIASGLILIVACLLQAVFRLTVIKQGPIYLQQSQWLFLAFAFPLVCWQRRSSRPLPHADRDQYTM